MRDDSVPVDEARALLREAVRLGVDLIDRSPVMLPIPGTGSIEHLRENVSAALR